MKKDLRKDQDWLVRAHLTPTSGPLPRRESWAERLARPGARGAAPRLWPLVLKDRPEREPPAMGLLSGRHPTLHPSQLLFGKEQVIALVMFSVLGPRLHGYEHPLP